MTKGEINSASANNYSVENVSLYGNNRPHDPDAKTYKLDPNTPCYTGGKNESLASWAYVVDKNMKLANIPTKMELDAIVRVRSVDIFQH